MIPRFATVRVMTRSTFGSHAFIPFVESQFITDVGRFGQYAHDASSVLKMAPRPRGGLRRLGMMWLANKSGTTEGMPIE